MLAWIIQIILISVCFVFLVHHLIDFLKETLTVPKIKDLVNIPFQRYQKMYDIIEQKHKCENELKLNKTNINANSNKDDMKNELKQFMKMQFT